VASASRSRAALSSRNSVLVLTPSMAATVGCLEVASGEPFLGFGDVGRERMKCSMCGSQKIDAKPELYPGGVVAMSERGRC
jgi:hypothetical protein